MSFYKTHLHVLKKLCLLVKVGDIEKFDTPGEPRESIELDKMKNLCSKCLNKIFTSK